LPLSLAKLILFLLRKKRSAMESTASIYLAFRGSSNGAAIPIGLGSLARKLSKWACQPNSVHEPDASLRFSPNALWLELVVDPQDGVLACEQLAIHYERRAKDSARATEFARLGLAKLQRMRSNSRDPYAAARAARLAEKLLSRINRLEHKPSSKNRAGACLSVFNRCVK
jgi:hypothetical protein